MKNPIQTFDKIKENLILYIKTAFRTRYPDFEEERKKLLNQDKILARSPWVEPLPKYKGSGYKVVNTEANVNNKELKEITKIPNLNDDELKTFKDVVSKGLVGDYELHHHQYEMLTKAMEGNHSVITSGTGSGKTESFLLPLFAYLSKELNKWRSTENKVNNNEWWRVDELTPAKIVDKNKSTLKKEALQRPDIKRPAAVRAMLIYPMNALVEDQLSRLRKALDSDKIRELLKSEYNDNRIYFGRYNSTSPLSGKLLNKDGKINANKIKHLKNELNNIESEIDNLNEYISKNPKNLNAVDIIDLKTNFQQLDGAEMRTRYDMQETPPDIMITNFSMLSIMLMREIEDPIFEKTKAWLECNTDFDKELSPEKKEEEKKNRVFHLIVDELHMYRGGSGSETAYIVRMLLHRLGLTPDSDQLRILASSASLEGDEGETFLNSFFGTEKKKIEIIKGTEDNPTISDQSNRVPLAEYVDDFLLIGIESDKKEKGDLFESTKKKLLNILSKDSGSKIIEALYSAFIIEDRVRAIPSFKNGAFDDTKGVKFISEVLFGESQKENKNVVKGFFFLLGLLDKEEQQKYPSMRFHLFYRNIAGMWGELIPDNEIKKGKKPIGKLFTVPEISHNNHRTLELLYCENCGTIAYGGSRVQYKDEGENIFTELIPVSPDIEGVPETSPATIVEKRKYKDFSVFIPGNYEDIIEPENNIKDTSFKFNWNKSWLNINSGKITIKEPHDEDNYISGYWSQIKDNFDKDIAEYENLLAKNTWALPPVCPHCDSDYSHPDKSRKSPFRGFRTGFGKISQILSKELFEELPKGKDNKKLVAFSDSREDAAVLAKNIEEEHYQALLKDVIIHNMTNELQFENDVITALEENDEKSKDKLKEQDEANYKRVNRIWRDANDAELATPEDKINLKKVKENIKSLSDFENIVIKEMLELGVNPAGPYKSVESFESGNIFLSWYNFYDFDTYEFDETIDGSEEVRKQTKRRIQENISTLIFGRLYFSFEASGLGFPTVLKNNTLKVKADSIGIECDILLEICNSFIRIWGNAYKHNRTKYEVNPYHNYSDIQQNRKERRYVKRIAENISRNEVELGNLIFNVLENNNQRGYIEINNLNIKIAKRDEPFYRCEQCGTIHLHKSGGVCIFCLSDLEPEIKGKVEDLWSDNYLTHNLNNDKKPFKLHTEELTGQTDNQLLRQRQFRNVFTNPDDEKIQKIDLLSVTTTLEVGVDIGSLQAIFLANMPPQRFNYQQRVGRTGRRGQLYSHSLTFARGRTHDEYYFANPLSITGDKSPKPFLSLDQKRIFKRVLAKAILKYGFKNLHPEVEGSVHGEFGKIEEYNKDSLQKKLDNNDKVIRDIFDSLNKGIYTKGDLNLFKFEDFKDWIHTLPSEISKIIESHNAINGDLSELLAESGMLPMAGMPTRIKNLIHGVKRRGDYHDILTIDRDLEMAIYEFAPGAQKTKDKGVIQSIGFTPNIISIDRNYQKGQTQFTPKCFHNDAFTNRKWLIQNNITKVVKSENYNKDSVEKDKERIEAENPDCNVFIGATPAAFRTDFKFPKDSSEDFDFTATKPLVFAETTDDAELKKIGNSIISYSQQEPTWKINTNGGKQFTGQYIKQTRKDITYDKQWIDSHYINDNRLGHRYSKIGEEETISLASRKVTEVFRIQPRQLDLCLDINPFESSDLFKSSASKGAFYSAAFLLQRTLADDLDIDPEEIEIAAIDSIELPVFKGINGRKSASIVLTDELPNGSGFVQQLYLNYEKYAKKCICPKEGEDLFNNSIISNKECFDASYLDLKNYRNMNFHPLLDWRLSVGLLRVFNDSSYLSGLKDDDYNHPEMKGWLDFAKGLSEKMKCDFDNIKLKQFGKLYGFSIEDVHNIIIVHPFWNYTHSQPSEEPNYLTKAIEDAGIEGVYFIDTFNLHRRPGWCYGELIKKIENEQ